MAIVTPTRSITSFAKAGVLWLGTANAAPCLILLLLKVGIVSGCSLYAVICIKAKVVLHIFKDYGSHSSTVRHSAQVSVSGPYVN